VDTRRHEKGIAATASSNPATRAAMEYTNKKINVTNVHNELSGVEAVKKAMAIQSM
jgi:hypothetical protein